MLGDGDGWPSLLQSISDGGFDGGLGCLAMAGLLSLDQAQMVGLMVV